MHFIRVATLSIAKGLVTLNSLYLVFNSQLLSHNYFEVIYNFIESCVKLASKFKNSTTPKLHITSGRGRLWGPAPKSEMLTM